MVSVSQRQKGQKMRIRHKCEEEQTPVIFRVWKDKLGDVIALFPTVKEYGHCCESYMRVGQHGAADYHHVIRSTRPAKEEEYTSLKKELESLGYNLKVYQKAFASMHNERSK